MAAILEKFKKLEPIPHKQLWLEVDGKNAKWEDAYDPFTMICGAESKITDRTLIVVAVYMLTLYSRYNNEQLGEGITMLVPAVVA